MTPLDSINTRQPFECDDWDALCSAIINAWQPSWGISLIWILSSIRYLKQFEKLPGGSWNVPLIWLPTNTTEQNFYKIFRKPKDPSIEGIEFEFHPCVVQTDQWLKAEISQSKYLTGFTKPEHAKFHMFYDEVQAKEYLSRNANWANYQEHTPMIMKVTARNLYTIDLIYIPPNHFMWGMDAKEMFVKKVDS